MVEREVCSKNIVREESGFKKSLNSLEVGAVVEGEGPEGSFILDENEKGPHVFLTGGIGITPFRAMTKYVIDKKLPTEIHVIYSNSIPEEIAFRKDLEDWGASFPNIKITMTITKPEESKEPWTGLTGRIDEKLINQLTSQLSNPTYWLCGPPPMVDAMEEVVGKLGISSNHVRSEKFTGY